MLKSKESAGTAMGLQDKKMATEKRWLSSLFLWSVDVRKAIIYLIIFSVVIAIAGCEGKTRSLEVTASAYTSNVAETDSSPSLAAWGDRLKPGMKAIAVSRDLIDMGLTHGTMVSIEGLDGKYAVLDKMNKRWKKKIDIYMGLDKKAAKEWGKRNITIYWSVESP